MKRSKQMANRGIPSVGKTGVKRVRQQWRKGKRV